MLRLSFILLFFLIGCAGTGNHIFNLSSPKSYEEYLIAFNSCTGKGVINSEGSLKGKLPFNFRSQRDSTFLEFSDMIGRKALFVWITNNSITARNLIDNRQYKYDEVTELLPILKVLEPKDITKINGKPKIRILDRGYPFITENGNIILDCDFGIIKNPKLLREKINQIAGVMEVGIFTRKPDIIYKAKSNGKFDIIK